MLTSDREQRKNNQRYLHLASSRVLSCSTILTTFLTFELNEARAWLCVIESGTGEKEHRGNAKPLKV